MITHYTKILEKIVEKMKIALDQGSTDVIQSEYALWIDFLRKLHPESELLKDMEDISFDNEFSKPIKQTSDIKEIIKIAKRQKYPTWFIQPKFCDDRFIFEYEEGQLKNVLQSSLVPDIQTIEGFSGKISGQIYNSQFLACDIDRHTEFLKKMKYLENFKLQIPEFVLFPTDKLQTVSSITLETVFHNYISKAQEQGLHVDGAVIVSDLPLFTEEDETNSRKIAFTLG